MEKKLFYFTIIMLTIIALVFFGYKVFFLKFPLMPESKTDMWVLEAEIVFEAVGGEPVKVTLYLPDREQANYAVLEENFITGKYGRKTSGTALSGKRKSIWTIREDKGKRILYYQAIVTRSLQKKLTEKNKAPISFDPKFEGIYKVAADTVIEDIKAKSADTESIVSELIKRLSKTGVDENIAVLLGSESSIESKIDLAVRLLNHTKIPARIVHGIELTGNKRNLPFLSWFEVYEDNNWRSYNPLTGEPEVPDYYFAWWRGFDDVCKLKGEISQSINISINHNVVPVLETSITEGRKLKHPLFEYSILNLPIDVQEVYRVLLLIPVAVLLLVISRNVVGIKTFGTFMPILIALAFRETGLFWGISLFFGLITFGLFCRHSLYQLKLLMVPRLASLLTIVILLMLAISILTFKLGLAGGLSVALFPMVIITMTIERMSIVWEERGWMEAIIQASGSLFVSLISYPVITSDHVGYLIFVFPEILLLCLAITILLGKYSGYRLSELLRFREFGRDINGVV